MTHSSWKRLKTAALVPLCLSLSAAAQFDIGDLDPVVPPIGLSFDAKMYPGAACRPYYGTQAFHFMTFQNGIAPRLLRNNDDPHPDAMWVTCPIVRDNTANTNGNWRWALGSGVHVWVDVPATSNAELLSCRLSSYDLTSGNLAATHSTSQRTQVEPNRYVLSLDVDRSTKTGYYVMRCYLPWKATLRAYRVAEFQSTDDNS